MKNTDTSGNKIRNAAQCTTRNATKCMTKCMTQSTFQKKILSLVQQAGDKVAEAMNLVDEAGAIAGINVHFERGVRSKLTERNEQGRWNQQDEWSDHRAKHPGHLDGDLCNRYSRNNHVDASNIFYEADEANEADAHAENYEADGAGEADEFDEADEADYSDEINEVTIPELAEMISERTCFRPECTLCVLNTAFDLMDEQNLMLDLGTLSADTPEGADTDDAEEDDEDLYDECDSHDTDGIDINTEGENSESYDDDDYYGDDSYDCDDCDDDELAGQPTRNTTRSNSLWLKN